MSGGTEQSIKSIDVFMLFALGLFLCGLFAPILYYRGLFGDGAFHLLSTLSTGWIHHDPLRYSALSLLQGPTLILTYCCGVTSVRVLSSVYVGSQLIVPALILLVSAFLLPPRRRIVALVSIIWLTFSYFLASLYSVSEVFTATALWWAILFFILGRDICLRDWVANSLGSFFMFLLILSYEPVAGLAILLLPLFILRNLKPVLSANSAKMYIIFSLMTGALLVSSVFGIYWTLFPVDAHRASLVSSGFPSLFPQLHSYSFWVLAAAAITASVSVVGPLIRSSLLRQLFLWTLWTLFALISIIYGYYVPIVDPGLQSQARFFVPGLMIVFSVVAGIALIGLELNWWRRESLYNALLPMILSLSVIHAVWQFEVTEGWRRYLSDIESMKVEGQAVNVTEQLQTSPFYWDWAVASLGILTTAMNKSIVDEVVYAESPSGWRPFNPTCSREWPNLKRLKIYYSLEEDECP